MTLRPMASAAGAAPREVVVHVKHLGSPIQFVVL
jgi:hypothetical protein